MAQGGGMISLNIDVIGIKELRMKMTRLHRAMQDYTEPLQRSEKYVRAKTAQAFRYGGAESQWKPLSPKTIAKKGSSAVLIDTGRLRSDATNSGNSRVSTGRVLHMTVPTEYAGFHQYGIGVPQRKFFVVLPQEERQIALFIRAYLSKQVNGR